MSFENFNGNYFPQANLNPYNIPAYQPRNSNQPVGGSFVWVNSRKEAEEYPLGANGAQMLMNRNEKVFYLKACDGFGMVQTFREFPYYEKTESENTEQSTAEQPKTEYVSREEFAALKAEFEALRSSEKAGRKKAEIKEETA